MVYVESLAWYHHRISGLGLIQTSDRQKEGPLMLIVYFLLLFFFGTIIFDEFMPSSHDFSVFLGHFFFPRKRRELDWRIGCVVYQIYVDRFAPCGSLEAKKALYPEDGWKPRVKWMPQWGAQKAGKLYEIVRMGDQVSVSMISNLGFWGFPIQRW